MRRLLPAVLIAAAAVTFAAPSSAFAAAPDLSVARAGPSTAAVRAPFTETLTVTNQGTAPTAGVQVLYSPGQPTVTGGSSGVSCVAAIAGHSGRGGGYTRVGWTCTETVPGGLAPGASATMSLSVTASTAGTLAETFTASPSPSVAQLNLVSHTASASVSVFVPPAPAAPTAVTATQTGDQLAVSWTPAPATAGYLISSTITAVPTGGSTAPTLTATGGSTSGTLSSLLASTTYSVTVVNRDAGGASPASAPLLFTTAPATVAPSAPTITYHWWANSALLAVSWIPGDPGNSAVDQYEVLIASVDGDTNQVITTTVAPPATSAYISADSVSSWSITVRAHNAAGWSPWSAAAFLSGI
jgi:hypothetical protein